MLFIYGVEYREEIIIYKHMGQSGSAEEGELPL
jgi:hypothetical protein